VYNGLHDDENGDKVMKHGYSVIGIDDGGEFSFGRCETKRQVFKSYASLMKSPNVEPEVKKSLRIVELVEKDITSEFTA